MHTLPGTPIPQQRAITPDQYMRQRAEYANAIARQFCPRTVHLPILMERSSDPVCDRVVEVITRFFRVTAEELFSRSRIASLVWPRHVTLYFLCEAGRTRTEAARVLGMNHTAACHARNQVKERVLKDAPFARWMAEIERELCIGSA